MQQLAYLISCGMLTTYRGPNGILLGKKVDIVKVEIMQLVIQIDIKAVVVTYDKCQVQVICLVI